MRSGKVQRIVLPMFGFGLGLVAALASSVAQAASYWQPTALEVRELHAIATASSSLSYGTSPGPRSVGAEAA